MKRTLILALKVGLILGLLAYCLVKIDLAELASALGSISWQRVVLTMAMVLLTLLAQAARLSILGEGCLPPAQALKAVLICNGCNYLLPARAGEIAKIMFIRGCGSSLSKSSEIVFWERFADANALLIVGSFTASMLGQPMVGLPLLAALVLCWAALGLFRVVPCLRRLPERLPDNRLGEAVREFMAQLLGRLGFGRMLRLGLVTAVVWVTIWATYLAALSTATMPPLTPAQVMAVGYAGMIGIALPGAPGGLGLFQAALVAAMSIFGVAEAQALALAIFLHAAMYLTVTLGFLWVAWRSQLSLRALRPKDSSSQ